jgi:hypothetical protein
VSGEQEWREPYPLDAEDAVRTWLQEVNPEVPEKQLVRDFLVALTEEPVPSGTFVSQGTGLPNHSLIVAGTDTQVVWVIIKSPPYVIESRCVKIVRIKRAPVD